MSSRRIRNCQSIADLRREARRRSHRMVFDYIDGGADDEFTLRQNTTSFQRLDIAFRVLTGVATVDTSTTLLGNRIEVPFICSPSAGNRLFHTEGERAVARAADAVGTIYSLSTLSTVSMEEVAALTPGVKWFQLYVWKDRGLVREMLSRARAAGYSALILTVDFAVTGNRERDARNGFTIPPTYGPKQVLGAIRAPLWTRDFVFGEPVRYANLSRKTPATKLSSFVAEQLHAGFNWQDAEWILGEWGGPAVIKGVVRGDDARKAVGLGFKAISISNHGGRQLDYSPAPMDALPEIANAVGNDAELILDGGVRRGTDILKAIALGARAVSFAKPYLYGLAAGGYEGALRALSILGDSFKRDMALAGASAVSQIDETLIRRYR